MATLAAGSGYDARSLPFAAPAGSWSAGQWGQYPSCYPSNGLQDTLATQQDLNNGMYLTGFQTSLSAQALGQVPPRRKCGRPKAPNPLDDPNIPEKKARRIMANRASADRSKQRAKLAAAQAKAELPALKTQLSDVSRQLIDTEDCLTVLELVQCAVGGLPAPQGAMYSLKQQLGDHRSRGDGKAGAAPEQRGTKRKLHAMQNPREQPQVPDYSEGMPMQPVLQPQQQQPPAMPHAAAWQAVQPPAGTAGATPVPSAAATAACLTQGFLASQLSLTPPAASAAPVYDAPAASSVCAQNARPPPQQQQKALDVLGALTKMLEPLQQSSQQQQQGRGWQQLVPLAADGMQRQQQQQQSAAMALEPSRAGASDLEQLLQQLLTRVSRA